MAAYASPALREMLGAQFFYEEETHVVQQTMEQLGETGDRCARLFVACRLPNHVTAWRESANGGVFQALRWRSPALHRGRFRQAAGADPRLVADCRAIQTPD